MNNQSPLKGKPLRNPGQTLDEQIETVIHDGFMAYFMAALMLWIVAGLEWLAAIRATPRTPGLYAFVAILATLAAGFQFVRVRRRVKNLKQGRDGERVVGQFLERLREHGAQVFHDIPGENFNLDHVVISPKGIFVIETKTWSKNRRDAAISAKDGALFKNGFQVSPNPIEQVVGEYKWLASLLLESTGKKLPAFGVVVFPGWFVYPTDTETKKVAWVLEPKALPAFIEQEPVRLSEPDVRLASFHLSRYIRESQKA